MVTTLLPPNTRNTICLVYKNILPSLTEEIHTKYLPFHAYQKYEICQSCGLNHDFLNPSTWQCIFDYTSNHKKNQSLNPPL